MTAKKETKTPEFLADYSKYLDDINHIESVIKLSTYAWIGLSHDMGQFKFSDETIAKEFLGTILDIKKYRQFVKDDVKVCQAMDGENGSKYGRCAECPYAQFGAGNTPPECSEYRTLLVQRAGLEKPEQFSVTAASLRNLYRYLGDLILGKHGAKMPSYAVVTKFKAMPEKKGAKVYAKVDFEIARPVNDIERVYAHVLEHRPIFSISFKALPVLSAPTVETFAVDTVAIDSATGKKVSVKGEAIEVAVETVPEIPADDLAVLDVDLDNIDDIEF